MRLTDILSSAARSCLQRFPAPAAFITALTVFAVCVILVEPESERLVGSVAYFLGIGFLLALSLKLWSEERTWSKKELAVHAVAYLILLLDSIYLYCINFGQGGRGTETFLMHASAILALTLTVFFLSFRGERTDIPWWNFALRVVTSAVVCVLIGGILWGGLSLLLKSMDWLFHIKLGWKWYSITGLLVAGYLPALLFLGRIPSGAEKHDEQPLRSAFLAGVFRYLFLPLEALYIVVLFVYALQILLRWELPNGQVSWLIIASMVGLIALEIGLYPTRHAENRRFDHTVARLLPLVLTPLLLLMTVGIVRRFSDYGITIARLYLITLNAWFYAVCIGLFLTRARRINWIPISFAALFLLTSALPLNYTNLTRYTLLREVKQAFAKAQATNLPLDSKHYRALMETLSQEEQNLINSKLVYLQLTFNTETIEPLVTHTNGTIFFSDFIREEADSVETAAPHNFYAFTNLNHLHIPEGYTELYAEVNSHDEFCADRLQDTVEVPVMNTEISDTIIVSLEALKALDERMDTFVTLPTKSSGNRYFLQSFSLISNEDTTSHLTLNGYLLTKETKK